MLTIIHNSAKLVGNVYLTDGWARYGMGARPCLDFLTHGCSRGKQCRYGHFDLRTALPSAAQAPPSTTVPPVTLPSTLNFESDAEQSKPKPLLLDDDKWGTGWAAAPILFDSQKNRGAAEPTSSTPLPEVRVQTADGANAEQN